MKKHRIFIAINLPDQIKKRLLNFQRDWAALPVRWTKEKNLHITLAFLGYVDNQELLEICQLTRQVVERYQSFEINLKRIYLGPPNKPARMIWLEGEENLSLARLKDDLEKTLFKSSTSYFNHGHPFRVHITLARIRPREWRQLPSKPSVEKEVSLAFSVNSVEVMESYLTKKGPDYSRLESILLK